MINVVYNLLLSILTVASDPFYHYRIRCYLVRVGRYPVRPGVDRVGAVHPHVHCLFVGLVYRPANSSMSSFQTAQGHAFRKLFHAAGGGDRIYEMRCLFVAVGPNGRFIVLPH